MVTYSLVIEHLTDSWTSVISRDVVRTHMSRERLAAYVRTIEGLHLGNYGRPSYMGSAFGHALASGETDFAVDIEGRAILSFVGADGSRYRVVATQVPNAIQDHPLFGLTM